MAAGTPKKIGARNGYEQGRPVIGATYIVINSELSDGEAAARAAVAALPRPSGLWTQRVTASNVNRNPLAFQVEIEYGVPSGTASTAEDPLDRPSVLSTSYEETTETYFLDEDPDGPKRVTNSAGDTFETLPERKTGFLIVQLQKNSANYPVLVFDLLKFTTNAEEVTIAGLAFPPNSLLFLPATIQETWERVQGEFYPYYQITYRFAVDYNLHVDEVEDLGLNELLDGYKFPILDDAKREVTKPVPLDNGWALPWLTMGTKLTFYPYKSVTWGLELD